jgi:hypothetical protein
MTVAMSEYVALARVVGHRDVRQVRVTECEVTRVFKGSPPARFVMIDAVWEREDQEEPRDVPQPTDSAVLFLHTDPRVEAPWKDWEALTRATNGLPVLESFAYAAEPVLLWRGIVGVADPDAERMMNLLLQAIDPDAPHAYGVVPLETYFERLEAAVEEANAPPPPGEDEPPTTDR